MSRLNVNLLQPASGFLCNNRYAESVSRSGVTPEPTVRVRMEENGDRRIGASILGVSCPIESFARPDLFETGNDAMSELLVKNRMAFGRGASPALVGAAYMVLAGILFALVNISVQGAAMHFGLPSSSVAFWQYAIALVLGGSWLLRLGLRGFSTNNVTTHILRVLAAAAGVQLWVLGLKSVPIWQAIALIMTSPFFVTIGASLFLRESVSLQRWLATVIGFAGGMIILAPWSDNFTVAALYPLGAAALWAVASLLTKRLTMTEAPDTVTAYLLVLLTPINAVFAGVEGFVVPTGTAFWLILLAGGLTALAQLALTRAYAVSDSSYVQPFDHLKLPLNVLFGWLAFQFVPTGNLWIGAALIVGASMYILRQETKEQKPTESS